ncbi:MAG: radical SAM protein, partial [Deltaproteobacteria bacterium]|nr:radical SAM protein [Deltaproteobacteria bacterium]
YCTYPIIEGRNMRLHDPGAVCDEIETMLSDDIDTIFIVDNEFNYTMDHALAASKEIIRRNIKFQWGCYANPAFVTPELIHVMRDAGCTGIEFGCDAACPEMLLNMGKNFTADDIKNASDICKQADMPFCHSLLLGGPGETMDTVKNTVDTVLQLSPTAAICMIGIRVFPNTRLSKIAENEGLVSPEDDYLEPVFYLSTAIENEIVPFIESFAKEHRTWIFPGLNINMNEAMQKKLRKFGIKGPMWEYMKRAQRYKKK